MSLHLNALPEDNPCRGCQHNCCESLVIGHPKKFLFPLPKGGCTTELLQEAVGGIKNLIQKFVEEILGDTDDGRFSVKGIALWPGHKPDSEQEIIFAQDIYFIALRLKVFLDCAAFDKETDICTRYDTRPDVCRNFSVETCGLSKVSKPKYKADGTVFTIPEIIKENRQMLMLFQPTIDEAVKNMLEEIQSFRL